MAREPGGTTVTQSPTVLCVAALLLSAGCATFRSGEAFDAPSWSTQRGVGKPSLALIVQGEDSWNGAPSTSYSDFAQWGQLALGIYENSRLFQRVTLGLGEADLVAWLNIDVTTHSNDIAVQLCFLTLIPFRVATDLTIELKVEDAHGGQLALVSRNERIHTWVHVLLLPVAPFHLQNSVASEVIGDLLAETLAEADRAGALKTSRGRRGGANQR